MIIPFSKKFWENVTKTETCWNWTGKVNGAGYGSIKFLGVCGAHRVSYEHHIGPIPKGYYVLHKCDNPRCVNPDHLWVGTQSDNMFDASKKGRMKNCYRWTTDNHWLKGKPQTAKNKRAMSLAKQRPFVCVEPKGRIIRGINLRRFCKKFRLNQGAMWSVIHGKKPHHKGWTKLPDN